MGHGSGAKGLLIGMTLGGITPGGPMTHFPVIASLFKMGVGIGPLVAYLSAWSLFGLQRVIMWEIPFLGPKVVALRIAVSFFFPLLAGWLCEWLWDKVARLTSMKRREFLKVLGLTGLGGLGQFGCASTILQSHKDTGLTHCYVCGEVTDDSALVWLRGEPGSRAALHYGRDPKFAEFSSTEPVTVDPQADSTAIIPLDDLEPATRYYYRALVAGKKPGPVATFVTAPQAR